MLGKLAYIHPLDGIYKFDTWLRDILILEKQEVRPSANYFINEEGVVLNSICCTPYALLYILYYLWQWLEGS